LNFRKKNWRPSSQVSGSGWKKSANNTSPLRGIRGSPTCASSSGIIIKMPIFVLLKKKNMKNYFEQVTKLRKSMIAEIGETLTNMNKSLVVAAGALSYIDYDLAFNSTSEMEEQVVPEVEIIMLTPDKEFNFTFTNAYGNIETPTKLSTDELWDICDYLADELHNYPQAKK
jgi:hypothetical protein